MAAVLADQSHCSAEVVVGRVFNIQRFSIHDGPGIRSTVFFKGCPLRCPWCHNPESVHREFEVAVNAERCLECGECIDGCALPAGPVPPGIIAADGDCRLCNSCVETCPSGAREIVGEDMTVPELMDKVLRDRLFFESSGGGVSFSGGEPLAQPEFLVSALAACRRHELHTVVDTSGFARWEAVEEVAEHTDLFLYDLKILDPEKHLELMGAPLNPIVDNLHRLDKRGVPIWLRVPLVRAITDHDENIGAIARLAASLNSVRRICLLPYHRFGIGKLDKLGCRGVSDGWRAPEPERIRRVARIAETAGVEVEVGGQ